MSVLEKKVFCAETFRTAWGLWQSKNHDPASKLRSFTVAADDGTTRINIGLLDYSDLETVVFPQQSHAEYAYAFNAIAIALGD